MRVVFDRDEPDIIIPCEGTYPYVRRWGLILD